MDRGDQKLVFMTEFAPKYKSEREFHNFPFIVSVSLLRGAERKPADPYRIKMSHQGGEGLKGSEVGGAMGK